MSEGWQGGAAGIAAGALLSLLLWRLNFFRWWSRRRYPVQVLMIIGMSIGLVIAIVLVGLLLGLPIDFVGGLLLGGVWCLVLPLLAGTRPVRRLRGLDEANDADERETPPAL